jgi:hypothetical protein
MGHKGDIDARYLTNKGLLPPDMIEEMRKSYKECEPLLSSTAQAIERARWIIILLGVPVFPLTYIDLIKADKDAIEKFGDGYKAYMKKVPRANFMLGLLRLIQKRRKQSQVSA